jgi:hypothetical protein
MGKFKQQRPPPASSKQQRQRSDHKKQKSFVDAVFGPLKSKRQGGGGGGTAKNDAKNNNTKSSITNKATTTTATHKVRKGRGPQDSFDAPMHSPHQRSKEKQPTKKRSRSSSGDRKDRHGKIATAAAKNTGHARHGKRPRVDNSTTTDPRQNHHSKRTTGTSSIRNKSTAASAASAAPASASIKYLQLPNATTSNVKIPWSDAAETNHTLHSSTTTKSRTPQGQGEVVQHQDYYYLALLPPYVTTWLDTELQAFAKYVCLTATERECRSTLIAHIAQLASSVFGTCATSLSTKTKVQCQVFGSFATLPVCTFASDVDLALWGVVEPLHTMTTTTTTTARRPTTRTTTTTTLRPIIDKVGNVTTAAAPAVLATRPTTTTHAESEPVVVLANECPAVERKRRWQAALAAIDDANAITNGHDDDDDDDKHENETSNLVGGRATASPVDITHQDKLNVACMMYSIHVASRSDSGTVANAASAKDPIEDSCSTLACTQTTTMAKSDQQAVVVDDNEDTHHNALTTPLLQSSTTANIKDCTGVEQDDDEPLFIIDRVGEPAMPSMHMERGRARELESLMDKHECKANIEETRPIVGDQLGCGGLLESAGPVLPVSGTVDHVVSAPLTSASSVDSDEEEADNDSEDDADPLESLLSQALQCAAKAESKQSLQVRNALYFHDTDGANDDDSSEDDADDLEYHNPPNDDDENSESAASLSDMHVSFVTDKPPVTTLSTPDGPQGRKREEVIRALASLSNKLRKSKLTTRVQLIKRARVPIIKVETRLGFEADIAVGGHNGADTSLYAATQVQKYSRQVKRTLAAKKRLSWCTNTLRFTFCSKLCIGGSISQNSLVPV